VTDVDPKLLADVATGLWRAATKPDSAPRHARRTLDLLSGAGVELVDHTGADFAAGVALDVVAFEEDPALRKETVIEVVRPSVYVNGVLVQRGEVIVGTPGRGEAS
jgi:hypothetical protein